MRNWLENSACVARSETQYLSIDSDLMTIGQFTTGEIPDVLQAPLEDALIWASRWIKMVLIPLS